MSLWRPGGVRLTGGRQGEAGGSRDGGPGSRSGAPDVPGPLSSPEWLELSWFHPASGFSRWCPGPDPSGDRCRRSGPPKRPCRSHPEELVARDPDERSGREFRTGTGDPEDGARARRVRTPSPTHVPAQPPAPRAGTEPALGGRRQRKGRDPGSGSPPADAGPGRPTTAFTPDHGI